MITYERSAFGLNLLLRVNGSAVYRAAVPGLLSVFFLLILRNFWEERDDGASEVRHPYAIGVLVASTTFLLVFRVQQAYARYWEAASSVHHMMSKWMDATIHTGCYHMQCAHYEKIKPPSFFDHPDLNKEFLTRDRESRHDDLQESVRIGSRAVKKSIERVSHGEEQPKFKANGSIRPLKKKTSANVPISEPVPLEGIPRLDGNWGSLFNDRKATYFNKQFPDVLDPKGFASVQGGRTPPLFLQELAHLSSLLVAVSLSTLRSDIEGSEAPLDIFTPGGPWPEVDPDKEEELAFHGLPYKLYINFLRFLGFGRSAEERTRYNASRPLQVIGGVSEGEIRFLQMARGPYAKTQLCWAWLSEFITREHLAGSTGNVGPPIISRIIQFLGDGMIYYNHARKVVQLPFPFPHAQLSVFYVLVAVPAVAVLMDQYTEDTWLGGILAFLTVTCLAGIHEVARELENPFRNIPNELPLVTFMAQYNEALLTMYSGYHPDAFWHTDQSMESIVPEEDEDDKLDREQRPDESAPKADASKEPLLDAKLNLLLERIEQQAQEIQRLRAVVDTAEEKKDA